MSKLTFVFVHGLAGWGSYDEKYKKHPYWGMQNGDLLAYLRNEGYDCYAASVAPTGSAWDRACELYAQITGARVDYGEAHSRRYRHDRYGRDFSGCPLIPEWNDDTRLVLIGHSFGGATVRLFSELLANGNADEREATQASFLSPFFAGGMGSRIYSIVALAAPMNGTTAYDMNFDAGFDPNAVKVPWWSNLLAKMVASATKPQKDARDPADYADFDMFIDHAMRMNAGIETLPHVYYFSVPCSCTTMQPDGTHRPARGDVEPLILKRCLLIGAYTGTTRGGTVIGDEWRENDGLVNTISAIAPSGAPHKPLDRDDLRPGIWNVFPTYKGDHMSVQGGRRHRRDVRALYLDLVSLIAGTAGE